MSGACRAPAAQCHSTGDVNGRVARSFAKAARIYELAGGIQQRIAEDLCGLLPAQVKESPRLIMEYGCGTGFLTRGLAELFQGSRIIASDIAPEMIAACARNLTFAHGNVHLLTCDAARLPVAHADLVISSMALQWLLPLPDILSRHRALAKQVIFAVPTTEGFAGLPEPLRASMWPLPETGDLQTLGVHILMRRRYPIPVRTYGSLWRHFRDIGAMVPGGETGVRASVLRKLYHRELENPVSYDVVFGRISGHAGDAG